MKSVYVQESNIQGFGMNIGEPVKRGEVISEITGTMQSKINENKLDALSNPNWVGVGKNTWIDPTEPYKFLNHSCNPSAGIQDSLLLVALRDMQEGEEITIDYSIIEGDALWEMGCACGESNCRKVIRSISSLPVEQFKSYLPYIPTYFKDLYLSENKV